MVETRMNKFEETKAIRMASTRWRTSIGSPASGGKRSPRKTKYG
jgi:hypothetical protein